MKKFYNIVRQKEYYYTEEFIEENITSINFDKVSMYSNLSESFLRKHLDKMCLNKILQFQIVSEEFLKENIDKLVLSTTIICQLFSKEFMIELFDKKIKQIKNKDTINYLKRICKIYQNYSF